MAAAKTAMLTFRIEPSLKEARRMARALQTSPCAPSSSTRTDIRMPCPDYLQPRTEFDVIRTALGNFAPSRSIHFPVLHLNLHEPMSSAGGLFERRSKQRLLKSWANLKR